MGTLGRVEIACRAPGSDTVEGKTAEWKSATVPVVWTASGEE
jgi:hypothetical protein